jgi:hypothetical protein
MLTLMMIENQLKTYLRTVEMKNNDRNGKKEVWMEG